MKKPPSHLSQTAKAMWGRIIRDFEIDDAAGLSLLRAACEAFERGDDARRIIKREGAVIKDRFDQLKPHPAVAIERDARGQLISALRALKLEPGEL